MPSFVNEIHRYSFPTNIYFGAGARRHTAQSLQERKKSRPLLVTDRTVFKLPVMAEFIDQLKSSGIEVHVHSEVWGNPTKIQVEEGVEVYKNNKCDMVIGFGGGAALDVSKVIAMMATHPGDLFDYALGRPNAMPIDKDVPPIFALPTTAGTGSEVGRASVISDNVSHQKFIFLSPKLLPAEVFVDPELTESLPAEVTAATGMDALTHLVEAFLSVGYHPMCEGIALEGMRLVKEYLPRCVEFANHPPADRALHLAARGHMMSAAYMGAVAFQKGLGVVHSCAHSLSTVCDLHHGLANGIMLPFCMKFNYERAPAPFVRMAEALGLGSSGEKFLQWVDEFKTTVGLPKYLVEVGVQPEQMDSLVNFAMKDGCHQENPCPVNEEDFRSIFSEALGL